MLLLISKISVSHAKQYCEAIEKVLGKKQEISVVIRGLMLGTLWNKLDAHRPSLALFPTNFIQSCTLHTDQVGLLLRQYL